MLVASGRCSQTGEDAGEFAEGSTRLLLVAVEFSGGRLWWLRLCSSSQSHWLAASCVASAGGFGGFVDCLSAVALARR